MHFIEVEWILNGLFGSDFNLYLHLTTYFQKQIPACLQYMFDYNIIWGSIPIPAM